MAELEIKVRMCLPFIINPLSALQRGKVSVHEQNTVPQDISCTVCVGVLLLVFILFCLLRYLTLTGSFKPKSKAWTLCHCSLPPLALSTDP